MGNSIHIPTDANLVFNLSKGNVLAFNELYHRYCKRLYRFAYGYLKSTEDSEELVQEVFTRIWENREILDCELSFKSYLYTISFNIIRKHFRKKKYISEYFKNKVCDDNDFQTTQEITYNSLYRYISLLANKLPEKRKVIFKSSRFNEKTITEIADELQISHKTVENQLTDALRYIRGNLEKEYF
jgi:RNA polymerase sigma-70 factor (family 1)